MKKRLTNLQCRELKRLGLARQHAKIDNRTNTFFLMTCLKGFIAHHFSLSLLLHEWFTSQCIALAFSIFSGPMSTTLFRMNVAFHMLIVICDMCRFASVLPFESAHPLHLCGPVAFCRNSQMQHTVAYFIGIYRQSHESSNQQHWLHS